MDALPPRQTRRSALPLGVWLATRGAGTRASRVLVGLVSAGAVVAALLGRGHPWVDAVPAIGSAAIAWSAGLMLAYVVSLRALHRDREDGILMLLRARGIGPFGYVLARTGGLVVVLAGAMGTGVACVGVAATTVSMAPLSAARASLGAIAYTLAFAATLGPLAMATVGGRSRALGYLTLLAVLALPEALAPWTRNLLPVGWRELTSIPAALDAVRHAEARAGAAAPAVRALLALSVAVVVSLMVVRARMTQVSVEQGVEGVGR